MKKFHIAISVANIEQSIADYSLRLEKQPEIVIHGEYALWRTEILNFSIRTTKEKIGTVRHIGWEDPDATGFTKETDVNGVIWENFNEKEQLKEINSVWPGHIKNAEQFD